MEIMIILPINVTLNTRLIWWKPWLAIVPHEYPSPNQRRPCQIAGWKTIFVQTLLFFTVYVNSEDGKSW